MKKTLAMGFSRAWEQQKSQYAELGPAWYAFSWGFALAGSMWLALTLIVGLVGLGIGMSAFLVSFVEANPEPGFGARWMPVMFLGWMLVTMLMLYVGFFYLLSKFSPYHLTSKLRDRLGHHRRRPSEG